MKLISFLQKIKWQVSTQVGKLDHRTLTFILEIHLPLSGFLHWPKLPWWLRGKSVCPQCGRPGFDPWVSKIPWRRKWHPTPVFLPGESHGQRSLVGYIQSTRLQRVGHNKAISLSFHLSGYTDHFLDSPQHSWETLFSMYLNRDLFIQIFDSHLNHFDFKSFSFSKLLFNIFFHPILLMTHVKPLILNNLFLTLSGGFSSLSFLL